MVDQRVAAEKQNGVGTPYIPPMTRRLKCRIDPEQSYELANKGTDTRTIQAISGIGTSAARCAIPSYRLGGSRVCSTTEAGRSDTEN